jgi:hypothetical protein
MATRKLGGRNTAADTSLFVGLPGELFYNPANGMLRVSDGQTAGGQLVSSGGVAVNLESAVVGLAAQWMSTGMSLGDTITVGSVPGSVAFGILNGTLAPGDNVACTIAGDQITQFTRVSMPETPITVLTSFPGQFAFPSNLSHSIVYPRPFALELHIHNPGPDAIDLSATHIVEIMQFVDEE